MLIDASTGSASTLSKAEWVDTHAHLNFSAFNADREKILKECLENEIWLINIGTNYQTSKKAVEIGEKYSQGVFASIGLHPINLDTGLVKRKEDKLEGDSFEKDFDFEKYKKLAQSKNVVAIGEVGLDYYWRPKTTKKKELFKQKQKELLLKQIKLAQELNLPVIFHCRMGHKDLIEVLKFEVRSSKFEMKGGVMHGFVGTLEQLKEYLKMGFYIGFNGIIFKKIDPVRSSIQDKKAIEGSQKTSNGVEGIDFEEIIRETPMERILIETDCPYLTSPNFGKERNNPLGVKFVAKEIAKIKNLSFEKIAEATTKNAKNLFKF